MQAFNEFRNMGNSFWSFIRYISENLGYSERSSGTVKSYSQVEIERLCRENGIGVSPELIAASVQYSIMRAHLLNEFVKLMLMDAHTAGVEFQKQEQLHRLNSYYCKIPFNKQKGEMKQVAYFTAMINIIAEKTIREITGNCAPLGFDDDPRTLAYFLDDRNYIIGSSSRRFDGAYPSIRNPKMVWEIKEYYYATTFGSRVADGVYETQLDGFEFKEIYNSANINVYHVLFIDAYRTWWIQGKSYLCRLVDAMNNGLVDEVIVGREVFTRWPELLKIVITAQTDMS